MITEVSSPFSPIDQISLGDSFRVKAVFNRDPGLEKEPVTIRVKSGKLEVQAIAHRTQDLLVFLPKFLKTAPRSTQ